MPEHTINTATATERRDLFRLIVESVRDYAIFHLDPQGYVQTWNEGARRIKGYSSSEIIGRHFSIFYPPSEARRGKPAYELAVAADEGRWEEEGWRLRRDGTRFWANVVITALRDEDGELLGYAKVTRDLTERKNAEEERQLILQRERQARREAEEALNELQVLHRLTETALSQLNPDGFIEELLERVQEFLEVDVTVVMLLDRQRNVLIPSAAAGIQTGIEQLIEIPLGGGFSGRIASEQRSRTIIDPAESEMLDPILREIGVISWLGVPLLAAEQSHGALLVGSHFQRNFGPKEERFLQIVADRAAMTIERARLIDSEQQARIDAELADARLRAQDAFLATAAHELRSPTATVKTAVQLLAKRLHAQGGEEQETMLPILEMADQQADRLTRLVDKLIESVRIDSGHLSMDIERTDAVALVQRAIKVTSASAGEERITLTAPQQLWVDIDPVRIEEVVINLLENAFKYSDDTIEVTITEPSNGTWQLSVRDHGTGVPLEHRNHLFRRFYQGPNRKVERGLGLGLYICGEIVTAHNGSIQADFPDDGGSRFTVTLPA